jgi:hypothetical protein
MRINNKNIHRHGDGFRIFSPIALFIILLPPLGCKKFVDVQPPTTNPVGSTVFSTSASASSAIAGLFESMQNAGNFFGAAGSANQSFTTVGGLSADEFTNYYNAAAFSQIYQNDQTNTTLSEWQTLYQLIYIANSIIDGLNGQTAMPEQLKLEYIGEAQFARAYCYFYLVNLFGAVPLAITTDYTTNESLSRASTTQVYQQIVSDLTNAQQSLPDYFCLPSGSQTTERTLPNKYAAAGMLARTYLYTSKWDSAEAEADTVIYNTSLFELVSNLNEVFLANSQEAIWQLEPVQTGWNTPDGGTYLLQGAPPFYGLNPVALSTNVVNAFEPGDLRRASWVDSLVTGGYTYYYPYKYKLGYTGNAPAEYLMMLRLSEQYLIRAEARVQQNNILGAQADLDAVRSRAGLTATGASSVTALETAVMRERQVELFCEWGQRWLDLKRTGAVDSVMTIVTAQKGGTWIPTAQLFPVPLSDLETDPNLVQNPGYN